MKSLYQSCMLFIMMTVVCGILYPLAIHGLAQTVFVDRANGSLVSKNGIVVGSELIAQPFAAPGYFWPRPSAGNFQTLPSIASNAGPTSKHLRDAIAERRALFATHHNIAKDAVPLDMITTSASGLDPHISLQSARIQAKRVAKARYFSDAQYGQLLLLIDKRAQNMKLTPFGEKMINVLMLNVNLDTISHHDG